MANAHEIAKRAVAAAAARAGTVRIESHTPLVIHPADLFEKTLIEVGISDPETLALFQSHLQRHMQEHLPRIKLRDLNLSAHTLFSDLAHNLSIRLTATGSHGPDEPPPPKPKPKTKGNI